MGIGAERPEWLFSNSAASVLFKERGLSILSFSGQLGRAFGSRVTSLAKLLVRAIAERAELEVSRVQRLA